MKLTRRLAALLLAVSLAPAPDSTAHPWLAEPGFQTQASSPRDLYVEAWFKETAESDLEGALKLYKQCADLAASSDRELAAKALLRMSRIATARGDSDAAKLLTDRLIAEFAGTAAAIDAAAPQTAAASKTAAESDEVREARALLDSMLRDSGLVSLPKCELVLRTLGVDTVLRFAAERGYSLDVFFGNTRQEALPEADWLRLATQAEKNIRTYAIGVLIRLKPKSVAPELLAQASAASVSVVAKTLELCAVVGTEEALKAAESLLAQRTEPDVVAVPLLFKLAALNSDAAKRLFEVAMTRLRAQENFVNQIENMLSPSSSDASQPIPLFAATPIAVALRSTYPTLPTPLRILIAKSKSIDAENLFPSDLTPQLLADPEPAVRLATIGRLLTSTSASVRRDAAQRLQREPRPLDLESIEETLRTARNAPFEELLGEVKGPLREAAYWNLLNNADLPRLPALLRYALEHSHPEAFYAVFDPRYPRSSEFGGITTSTYVGRDPQNFQVRGFDQLESDSDPDLLLSFVRGLLGVKDETLWIRAFMTWSNAVWQTAATPRRTDPRILDLFASTPSNRLHARIASSNMYSKLSDNTLAHLVLEAEPSVRDRLIQASPPARLVSLVAKAPLEDMSSYLDCAEGPRSSSLALEVLKRVDPASRDALRAVQLTIDREPEALPIALERGSCDDALGHAARVAITDAAGSSVRADLYFLAEPTGFNRPDGYVFGKLQGLDLEESLRTALEALCPQEGHKVCPSRDWALSAAKVLREQQDAWSRALRDLAGRKILGVLSNTTGTDLGWLSAQLAELEQGDLARELLTSRKLDERILGAKTLARLGAKEDLIAFARSSGQVNEWLKPLIEVGARDELLAMVDDRRLTPEEILQESNSSTDPELLIALVTGNGRIVNIPNTGGNQIGWVLPIAAETLSKRGDVDGLLQLIDLYGSSEAVNALARLEAYDRMLDRMPNWSDAVCRSLEEVLRPRTGIPEIRLGSILWRTRATRVEMAEKWRQALRPK